ncbi:MAG TPA: agmatine deiminase family protein [Candidatus Aquilonibacter sp.]|nr:agmatine deiminase family protein [Candidatus Aquilonibacter sp.]
MIKNSGNSNPYRMPAEWEPHAATWLAWPHHRADWPGKFESIPWVYAEIIRHLARHERVELIVNNAAAERQVRKSLDKANALSNNVRFHRWPTNRVWLRDSGCIFVRKHEREGGHDVSRADKTHFHGTGASAPRGIAAVKFRFNAWAKYSNWGHDEKIGSLMAAQIPTLGAKNARRVGHFRHGQDSNELRPTIGKARIVLEGGSIDVNGQGTLLTTEECLLSTVQQRNPGMARAHYEKIFADYLGAPHVIWLGRGIAGDDTHGHVDDLTRFVSADTVVTMVEHNSKDVNHAPLRANLRRLQSARNQDGRLLNIVEVPMPGPVIFEKRRLPASYANFYIANGVVLAPVFNHANDRIALNTLAELFPSREVVPIYSGDFIWGLGAMHCMTQQQPQ